MKRISFNLRPDKSPEFYIPPQPASQFIPKWYRDGENFINREDGSLDIPDLSLRFAGMKSCAPFLDTLLSGYIQPLSHSIEITKNNGIDPIEYRYVEKDNDGNWIETEPFELINERDGMIGHTIPRPMGCSHNHMVWSPIWGWEVPKGWSVLVTHPLNRYDLPFITLSGIMESDKFTGSGNVPFFIKKDFIGVIEKGTPLYQLIPIKRAKWIGYVKRKVYDKVSQMLSDKAREVPYGYYRDNMWEKKVYEMEK